MANRLWSPLRENLLWLFSGTWAFTTLSVGSLPYGERVFFRGRQCWTSGFELWADFSGPESKEWVAFLGGLRTPSQHQKELYKEIGPSRHSWRHPGLAPNSLSLMASLGSREDPTHSAAIYWVPVWSEGSGPCPGCKAGTVSQSHRRWPPEATMKPHLTSNPERWAHTSHPCLDRLCCR